MAKVSPGKNASLSSSLQVEDVEEAPERAAASRGDSLRDQLLVACETGNIDLLDEFLVDADKDRVLSVRDSQTWPLLAIAASRGHERLIQRLLDFGCPVDITDDFGSTPLYRAVGFRQNACVKALLAAGADIRHVNKDGNNIIHNSAYVCNDTATIQALKAGVDPTQPNAVERISLLDMVEKQPHLALVYLDSKVKPLSNYVQYSKMLYDFTGLDYKDSAGVMDSPLEAMINKPAANFLLQHMLVKQYLQWQWRLYGRRFFIGNFVQHVSMLLLVTYIAITSMYKWLEPNGAVYEYSCCSSSADFMLDVLRAAAELLLLPLCGYAAWREVWEYRKTGNMQVRVHGPGVLPQLLRMLFRADADIHQTRASVVSVPRYLLDVWNLLDAGTLLLMVALGAMRVAAIAKQQEVLSPRAESYILAVLVMSVWVKLLALAGVFRTTGPQLRVLRRMLINVIEFSSLYLLFFVAVSVALFLVLGAATDGEGKPVDEHRSLLSSFMGTFQITLGNADYTVYELDPLATVFYFLWTIMSTLLLLSLLIAILSYDFQVGVEVAEQEWLVVFGGYLLRTQRLLGDAEVQRLKADDLQRCHEMGGFQTPVREAKTNLPAAHSSIPAKLFVIWEDTTTWPPEFREQMERSFSFDDQDFSSGSRQQHRM
ncbi:hypothetical protein PLESTB_000344300 [Pleodorina starrii]|uniref:Ion transport domain-containing protein n=1 Tax=Pleodorina starrii TaxID=330485 RepID=A0A9W6BEN4_9CHLO|nr:hypothetical protein PLESTB_000344300 [Pleodorina starrii]GLC73098.1 hypothetical protein PLESTF_001332000 [Pleodorina starrii]